MDPVRLTISSPTQTFSHTTENASVKIGRSNTCDFCIPKDDLSREQCLFEVKDGEYYVTDLGSKNGIHVDRVRLKPHTPVKVTEKSIIVLSNIYTLKINAYDVKTKIGILTEPKNEKTVTFALELPEEPSQGLVQPKRKKKLEAPENVLADDAPAPMKKHQEMVKMAVGFIIILGFIVYQVFFTRP